MTSNDKPASGGADGLANSSLDRNDAKPSTPATTGNVLVEAMALYLDDLLSPLFSADCDPAERIRARNFLLRVCVAQASAIGYAPPAPESLSRNCRIAFKLKGESRFGSEFLEIEEGLGRILANDLARVWGCPVVDGEPWTEGGAA